MIKTFESFKNMWKKGDIVVCIETFCSVNNCVYKNSKYKINNISPSGKIEIRNLSSGLIISQFFPKYLFITEEEWNMRNDAKKYNL